MNLSEIKNNCRAVRSIVLKPIGSPRQNMLKYIVQIQDAHLHKTEKNDKIPSEGIDVIGEVWYVPCWK